MKGAIVKIILVVGLLKNRPRAYPASLIVFGLFMLYQVYLLTHKVSLGMAALAVFDIIVMYFIWREWQIMKAHQHKPATN